MTKYYEMTLRETMNRRNERELTKEELKSFWYDWFCKDKSLVNKAKALMYRVSKIYKLNEKRAEKKFNPDTSYVWFKNNCPCCGNLYDDFRIADCETGDVIYTIVPASGFDKNFGEAELWGRENDFEEPIVSGSWKDIMNYFKN